MIPTVILGLICLTLVAVIYLQAKSARFERAELEDRLMALSRPEALVAHKAYQEPEPASVTYVDEARELDLDDHDHLRNGHINVLGDD